jgi:hypothetical protein
MDHAEIGCVGVGDPTEVAQDRVQWGTVVNTVMNTQVS